MKNPVFTGSAVAIITPMNDDFSINYDEFKRFIDWQIDNGTDAIVICGTTGESSTLKTVHHLEAIKFCVEYVNGRVPVIAGAGSNNTECGLDLAVKACEYGVDALLLVTPYYNKCTQKGLIKHYTMYHEATNVPLILYNVPSRTGVNITPETLKELSKLPRVNGVKEASGNISQVMKVRALCGDDLNIWSGNDDQIPAVMACGGKGVISVLSNICPRETHDMVQAYLDGDANKCTEMMAKYLELANAMFVEVNPIPVKAAVNMMGWNAGPCKMPLCEMSDEHTAYVKDVMQRYGLIK
ncbi:4-hydroxy-tetrahydrodipicolinate synthase [uncultured Eubacterium sp.]|uniref:4-hydroxy-tetrahydrodipicolinate synthase n=1 Tax=uncultured Eubacterium sp. TaxID=165185 RepID=UPI0028052FAA|nr:4-hydroxy-tetrahydrodipicolinate synthase [uncultured Eubacterium sp.]